MHQTTQPVGLHDSLRARAFGLLKSPTVILGAGASPLFRLPTEVRLLIYEFVFTLCKKGDSLGLLRVCQKTYLEAYPIALAKKKLRFQSPQKFVNWWLSLGPKLKPKVKRVEFTARKPDDIHEIPARLMRGCADLRLHILTLVFEEEMLSYDWLKARTTGLFKVCQTMNLAERIDVVDVINRREGNTPHLSGIFAMLRECAKELDRDLWVYGFVEETSSGTINPGYRMVRRARLDSVLEMRGTNPRDLEKRFLADSERVYVKYPEPPVRQIRGTGPAVMFMDGNLNSYHHFRP